MPFGGFAPFPLRLGGSAQEGLSPEQHARICADLVAAKNVAPLAVWTYTKVGAVITISDYRGQNGIGSDFAPTAVAGSTGVAQFDWQPHQFTDPYGVPYSFLTRHGRVSPQGAVMQNGALVVNSSSSAVARTWDSAGTPVDTTATVVLW